MLHIMGIVFIIHTKLYFLHLCIRQSTAIHAKRPERYREALFVYHRGESV